MVKWFFKCIFITCTLTQFSPLFFLIEWALVPVALGRKKFLFEKGVRGTLFSTFDFPSLIDTCIYAKFGRN